VMPNGTVNLPNVQMGQGRPSAANPERFNALNLTHDTFADDLLNSIIPFVEGHYRALTDQPNRAIAGLSMGGAQTLRLAPQKIDKFAYIGVFSMGWHDHINPDLETRNEKFFGNPAETNKALKLFWIGCGKADSIIGDGDKKLDALFTRRGIKHEFHESEGGHTYINWRAYLREYAPRLFR
jgi:enterochelin esterase-like enzyme